MKIEVKKIYDSKAKETGAIVTALVRRPITADEKSEIENRLKQYAFDVLYLGIGLNIYHDDNDDRASIIVIINIDELEFIEFDY